MIPNTNIIIYVCKGVGKDPVVKHSSFNCPGYENKVPLPTMATRENQENFRNGVVYSPSHSRFSSNAMLFKFRNACLKEDL